MAARLSCHSTIPQTINEQKLNDIHENPVKEGIVFNATAYVYSSACNYSGAMGVLHVDLIV